MIFNLSFFSFIAWVFGVISKILPWNPISLSIPPVVSSKCLIVLTLSHLALFNSFYVNLVYGIRLGPNCYIWHVDIQFSQKQLLNVLSFPNYWFLRFVLRKWCQEVGWRVLHFNFLIEHQLTHRWKYFYESLRIQWRSYRTLLDQTKRNLRIDTLKRIRRAVTLCPCHLSSKVAWPRAERNPQSPQFFPQGNEMWVSTWLSKTFRMVLNRPNYFSLHPDYQGDL